MIPGGKENAAPSDASFVPTWALPRKNDGAPSIGRELSRFMPGANRCPRLTLGQRNWNVKNGARNAGNIEATAKVVGNASAGRSDSRIAALELWSSSEDTGEVVVAVAKFSRYGDFETPLIPTGEVILRCVATDPEGSKDVRVLELTLRDGDILHQDFIVPEGNQVVTGRIGVIHVEVRQQRSNRRKSVRYP